jgi:hypothetical protein
MEKQESDIIKVKNVLILQKAFQEAVCSRNRASYENLADRPRER